jgi:hypothetical protein
MAGRIVADMNYSGSCKCKQWKIRVSIAEPLSGLNPRVCDCDYCRSHPSAVISDPRMTIELIGASGNLVVNRNGDRLASFYHCTGCGELLAVGCEIDGRQRGAVNGLLLDQKDSLGDSVPIQPRLLSREEKLSRWGKLWGTLLEIQAGR